MKRNLVAPSMPALSFSTFVDYSLVFVDKEVKQIANRAKLAEAKRYLKAYAKDLTNPERVSIEKRVIKHLEGKFGEVAHASERKTVGTSLTFDHATARQALKRWRDVIFARKPSKADLKDTLAKDAERMARKYGAKFARAFNRALHSVEE